MNNFADAFANGYIRHADTIGEAAKVMKLDPSRVEATVAQYNKDAIETGVDSLFGRILQKDAQGRAMTIDVAPFYYRSDW